MKKHVAPVYDRKNQDRLLGYLTFRPTQDFGPWYRLMAMDMPRACLAFDPSMLLMNETVHYVEFEFGWRTTEGGWRKDKVMLTDCKLETLMKVREFRLPGETEQMHEARLWTL